MTQLRNASLGKMFSELQRQKNQKMDLIVPSDRIVMRDGKISFIDLPGEIQQELVEKERYQMLRQMEGGLQFETNETADSHICQKLKIPRRFYRYLKEDHVDLLDYNVSMLFDRAEKNYFIRTFLRNPDDHDNPGLVRAVLSDQFKVIDHVDVLGTTLNTIQEMGVHVTVGRCNLTDDNMYAEIISETAIQSADELLDRYRSPRGRDGDNRIFSGFVISNSETGQGRYKVQPRAIVNKCNNGLTFREDALASTHLGSKMDSGVIWEQDTIQAEIDLIQKQTRDAVGTFLSREYLGKKVDELMGYTGKLENPIKAVNNVCKSMSLDDESIESVVNNFMQGGDDSAFGVLNAVTLHAQSVDNPDLQYEMEEEAMDILPKIHNFQYN